MKAHKDLKRHEEDNSAHFLFLSNQVFALTNEIVALKKEVKELQAPKKHVFKMTDFHKYKEEERPFHSPLFSNQENSYKMVIRVLSYDHIEGKGTHVSVYVHLMRGLFDSILSQPFTGSVQIELLNQLCDKHHLLKSITLPEDNKLVPSGVADNEGTASGWGFPQFIALDQLGPHPELNRQYLKDDCLFFRISVILSEPRDWLQCS